VVLPFLALAGGLFSPPGEHWAYVRDNLLSAYFAETVLLAGGAGLCACALGVVLAWFTSLYDFRGKALFEVLLVLPLALPPYIAAYANEGLWGYTGMAQSFFRNEFGIQLGWLTSSIPAQLWAVWVFTATLFPYVYILSLAFLHRGSAAIFENALLLGGGGMRLFFKVGLPLLRPAAVSGTILVCLEVLSDFGVCKFYGLNTFTTAIFSAWFGMGDADTAVKLALILLAVVFAVLFIRKAAQRTRRRQIVSTREKPLIPRRLTGGQQVFVILFCGCVVLVSFGAPLAQFFFWLALSWEEAFTPEIGSALFYSFCVSGAASLLIMTGASATVNAGRHFRGRFSVLLSQGAALGYAIPSAVLAVGVISLFTGAGGVLKGLGMSGFMLLFAYCIRFFSIGLEAVEEGFAKTGMLYAEASRSLGRGVTATFFRVDIHLIRHALCGGFGLVFIDILKELPLGFLLRPFNTETLGTTVYHFANNEVLEKTALPSLCIVLVGAAVITLSRYAEKRRSRVSGN
jgi:iron(III) transport system permease protein